MIDAAKADGPMTKDSLDKMKKSIMETLTSSLAPPRRASRSPARETITLLPPFQTASSSPPPLRTASSSPAARQTSRSPTPEKTGNKPVSTKYRRKSPFSYEIERCTYLHGDSDYACKINKYWRENKNPQNKRMLLFNTLFSSEKLKNIEEPYERSIRFAYIKDSAHHPFYREPCDEDELSLWTRNTKGVEELHSMLIPCHPTRFTHLHVFSCTTKDWLVLVVKDHIKANTLAKYLAVKLEPFYAEGRGEIVCPVCISYIRGETFWPMRYTRGKFMTHFKRMHQELEGTAYLGFATGYSTRMYEAKTIYAYCMANVHANPTNERSASPFKGEESYEKDGRRLYKADADSTYGVFYITLLKDLFERTGTVLDQC
jgi:hypothetical protein